MTDASGNPSGFSVMLYGKGTQVGTVLPGSSLGSLSGSAAPTTAGTYTYTAPANLELSPDTYYFIVLTAGTTVANGAYDWSFTSVNSYNPGSGWGASLCLGSSDGSSQSWSPIGAGLQFDFSQFAINASAVPEPSSLLFLSVGSGAFLCLRRFTAKSH
jgi:hypothetical protein